MSQRMWVATRSWKSLPLSMQKVTQHCPHLDLSPVRPPSDFGHTDYETKIHVVSRH